MEGELPAATAILRSRRRLSSRFRAVPRHIGETLLADPIAWNREAAGMGEGRPTSQRDPRLVATWLRSIPGTGIRDDFARPDSGCASNVRSCRDPPLQRTLRHSYTQDSRILLQRRLTIETALASSLSFPGSSQPDGPESVLGCGTVEMGRNGVPKTTGNRRSFFLVPGPCNDKEVRSHRVTALQRYRADHSRRYRLNRR
jgi:hypothetical protein